MKIIHENNIAQDFKSRLSNLKPIYWKLLINCENLPVPWSVKGLSRTLTNDGKLYKKS